jgi:ATP-binding cassette subfamily B (MDR/TAP) protein 1
MADEKIHPTEAGNISAHSSSVEDSSANNEKRDGQSSPDDEVSIEKLDSRIINVKEDVPDPLRHLSPQERVIVERQLDIPDITVTFKTLFRYATTHDLLIIALSTICAIAGGAIMPLMTVGLESITCEL